MSKSIDTLILLTQDNFTFCTTAYTIIHYLFLVIVAIKCRNALRDSLNKDKFVRKDKLMEVLFPGRDKAWQAYLFQEFK